MNQSKQADAWKDAVLDELANCCMDAPQDEPPASILRRVIRWNVDVALDPAVSERAASLATQAQQGEPAELLGYVVNVRHGSGAEPHWLFTAKPLDNFESIPVCRYAAPSTPARQAVRMLTEDEAEGCMEWTLLMSEVEAIQRKFCEVNALPLEQQEGGK